MKIFRKIAAALSAAVIAVSACASMAVTAGADSIYDTAKAISSGKSVSTILPAYNDTADYKITVSGSGTLKFSIESQMKELYMYVYDSDGNKISTIANTDTSGYSADIGVKSHYMVWNNTVEKYKGTVSYSVKSGTYYIRFNRTSSSGNGKLTFTATYPTGSSSKAKINYITLNLSKGDSLSLGADMTGSGTVTWKSSNSSAVSVTSSGRVTAKGYGSAIITAKVGKTTKKIKIVVS